MAHPSCHIEIDILRYKPQLSRNCIRESKHPLPGPAYSWCFTPVDWKKEWSDRSWDCILWLCSWIPKIKCFWPGPLLEILLAGERKKTKQNQEGQSSCLSWLGHLDQAIIQRRLFSVLAARGKHGCGRALHQMAAQCRMRTQQKQQW